MNVLKNIELDIEIVLRFENENFHFDTALLKVKHPKNSGGKISKSNGSPN